jgi:hypothetical protein
LGKSGRSVQAMAIAPTDSREWCLSRYASPGWKNLLGKGKSKREEVYVPFPAMKRALSNSAATWIDSRASAPILGIIRIFWTGVIYAWCARKNSRSILFIRLRTTALPKRRVTVIPSRDRLPCTGVLTTTKWGVCRRFPRCCRARNSRRISKRADLGNAERCPLGFSGALAWVESKRSNVCGLWRGAV